MVLASTQKLQEVGFVVSKIDNCAFYYEKCIYILYVDNSIICGPTKDDVRKALCILQKTKLKFTIEGDIGDFLRVNILRNSNGTISLM